MILTTGMNRFDHRTSNRFDHRLDLRIHHRLDFSIKMDHKSFSSLILNYLFFTFLVPRGRKISMKSEEIVPVGNDEPTSDSEHGIFI